MGSPLRSSSLLSRHVIAVVIGLVLAVAMVFDTTFLSPDEATAINPPVFKAEVYAAQEFPKIATAIASKATDVKVLAPAIDADPAAAGKQFGTEVGAGTVSYPLKATGTVSEVDANFILLMVPGMDPKDKVRIPLGAALSGTPIRDATGTITFGDFEGQSDFQSVANQFKLRMQTEVLAKIDVPSLKGKQITVIGAWNTGGPPNSYIIQPVSLVVAS